MDNRQQCCAKNCPEVNEAHPTILLAEWPNTTLSHRQSVSGSYVISFPTVVQIMSKSDLELISHADLSRSLASCCCIVVDCFQAQRLIPVFLSLPLMRMSCLYFIFILSARLEFESLLLQGDDVDRLWSRFSVSSHSCIFGFLHVVWHNYTNDNRRFHFVLLFAFISFQFLYKFK
jgi:hypothetical protein